MVGTAISDSIFQKFADSIKDEELLSAIAPELVKGLKAKQPKNKIKELLGKIEE
jgi:hypothetical protein